MLLHFSVSGLEMGGSSFRLLSLIELQLLPEAFLSCQAKGKTRTQKSLSSQTFHNTSTNRLILHLKLVQGPAVDTPTVH